MEFGGRDGGKIIANGNTWKFDGQKQAGHQQEQHDLIEALMRGEVYNEGDYGARSTFTAILGREACYSGQIVKWDKLLAEGRNYAPGIDEYTMQTPPPVVKGADGKYPPRCPGFTIRMRKPNGFEQIQGN